MMISGEGAQCDILVVWICLCVAAVFVSDTLFLYFFVYDQLKYYFFVSLSSYFKKMY